ncbi:MAG: LysR family transcriptional regulator [Asticcacaulis sp.]|nr:LysR family transcriptional regulator [Asticcacaulis sp.]
MDAGDIDLADLRAFFMVAETGSFARAALRLETAKSIVSRRLTRLEGQLGAQLLQRTAGGTFLSEAGQSYYENAQVALTQLESAAESLKGAVHDLEGHVRVTVPVFFGAIHLAAVFCDFMRLHPGVELEINACDDKLDIARLGYDLAVRTGHLPDSSLSCRPLWRSPRRLVASADYLAAHPVIRTPEDLVGHRILHYNSLMPQDLWRYHVDGATRVLNVTPYLRSNSGLTLMTAVTAGLGLTVLPGYIVDAHIRDGRVAAVLPEVDWGLSPVNLLIPAGRRATRRVRALVDFLVQRFETRST